MLDLCKALGWKQHFSNSAPWEPQGLWGLQTGGRVELLWQTLQSEFAWLCVYLPITPVQILGRENECDLQRKKEIPYFISNGVSLMQRNVPVDSGTIF